MHRLTLYKSSDFNLGLNVSPPSGRTVTKLIWTLKRRAEDPDAQALLVKSTTTILANQGQVRIEDPDLAAVEPGHYWHACKAVLDDGSAVPTDIYGVCEVRPAMVEATS